MPRVFAGKYVSASKAAVAISIFFSLCSNLKVKFVKSSKKSSFLNFFEKNIGFFGVKTAKNAKYVVTTIDSFRIAAYK